MRNNSLLIVFCTQLNKDVQEANTWDPVGVTRGTEANEPSELLNEEVHRLQEDIYKEISRNTALLQGIASASKQDAVHVCAITSPGSENARVTNEKPSHYKETDNTQAKKLILLLRSQRKSINAIRGEITELRKKSQLGC